MERFVNCCDVVARVPPQQFDARHIEPLLSDLTGHPAAARLAAGALESVLSRAVGSPDYQDVAPPRYITRHGTVGAGGPGDDVTRDQETARREYRAAHALGAFRPANMTVDALFRLIETVRSSANVRQAIGRIAHALFLPIADGTVPLRDLADHAPINYVSAMVRSFGAPARHRAPST